MSKERISASIDADLAELLDQEHINTSGTVNKLLRKYFDGGGDEEQILDFRIQQVESEIDELESRLETKREELSRLRERKNNLTEEREDVIQRAVETLGQRGWSETDQQVQFWSAETGLDESELLERVDDYYNGG